MTRAAHAYPVVSLVQDSQQPMGTIVMEQKFIEYDLCLCQMSEPPSSFSIQVWFLSDFKTNKLNRNKS